MISKNNVRDFAPQSLIAHLCRKLADLPEIERDIRIDECLKFLFLASVRSKTSQDTYAVVSQSIDDVWHECILQTREYALLCERLPAQCFVHHSSSAEGYRGHVLTRGAHAAADEHVWWLENYYAHFGDLTAAAAKHWSGVTFLMDTFDLSIDDINRIASGEVVQKSVTASFQRA
ncbi:hypothetical protein ACPWR0_03555 [Pandoraea pneumonica]|uniref:hypothetical protein n=1 Tax=Pandoraea pneumonica TaxID=2508299 RepID=UPI003CEC51A0